MSSGTRSRKRKAQATVSDETRSTNEAEFVNVLQDMDQEHGQERPGNGKQAKRKSNRFVDFEAILQDEVDLVQPNRENPLQSIISDQIPEMMRCGGDDLTLHVPEQIKVKIRQHQYINLAVLLKGPVELTEMCSGSLLTVNEQGQLETRSKPVTEKIQSIAQWTDAFLIYASIYLAEHPSAALQLIRYISLIREASQKYVGFGWRVYDEQFRLRQAIELKSWGEIRSDLWLRCFSGQSAVFSQPHAHYAPTALTGNRVSGPKCIDFNTGQCHWSNCRYQHACFICSSQLHGKHTCPMNNPSSVNQGLAKLRAPAPRPFRARQNYYRASRGAPRQ